MTSPLGNDALDQVFLTARTFNSYLDRPVELATLRNIYDLLKWGPTSTNQQPMRIVWCLSAEAKALLASHCADGNAAKVLNAPVTAILGMDLNFVETLPRLFPYTDARPWYAGNQKLIEDSAFRNSTLQGAYLIVAARMLGLDTNGMSGFDEDGVNAEFFKDRSVKVNFITTLGYGDRSTLYPRAPRFNFEEVNEIR